MDRGPALGCVSKKDPEVALEDRELEHREVAERELLEASGDPATLLEPRDAPLDDVPESIGLAVEVPAPAATALLVGPLRDHGLNLAAMEPVADVAVAVAPVSDQALGAPSSSAAGARNPNRLHQRLEADRLVALARADVDRQRQAVAVRDEVKFGAETPARAP